MYELLRKNIEQNISINNEEWELILEKMELLKLRKNQFLQTQGNTSKYEAYVIKGVLKIFTLKENGSESILNFVFENDWLSDFDSFNNQKPSKYSICAIEDCEILAISKAEKTMLLKQIPKIEQLQNILLKKDNILMQERLLDVLNKTSKQRYLELILKNPAFIQKISNKNLSSYLGVSHEFLSKIKKISK